MARAAGQERGSWIAPVLVAIATGSASGLLGNLLTELLVREARPGVAMIVGLLLFAGGVSGTVHYWLVMGYGGAPKGSAERDRYNRMRTALRGGGRIGPLYERMLRATLDAVDRFFGDKDQADRTLFPHAFGLKERAPLWTANSYNRCLLIALVYPMTTILLMWAATGHVGPAEAALALPPAADGWRRALAVAGLAMLGIGTLKFARSHRNAALLLWGTATFAGIGIVGLALGGPAFAAVPLLFLAAAASGDRDFSDASGSALLVSFGCGISAAAPTFAYGWWAVVLTGTVTMFLSFSAYVRIEQAARRAGAHGIALVVATILLFVAASAVPWLSADIAAWTILGPILLFLILLAIVNAPFDWLTLGLTRALLRRGLELGGWWPLAFGIIDLAAATAVVVVLAVATLWAVQLFGHFTLIGGGALVLDAAALLEALGDPERRAAPEHWWLYAMLFSTLVPSIVNVALGALSLVRGVPGLHRGLTNRMKLGQPVLAADRMWMAPLLAFQTLLGFAVGVAVMLGLLAAILGWLLPAFGVNLVPLLQALAEQDWPGRALAAIGLR